MFAIALLLVAVLRSFAVPSPVYLVVALPFLAAFSLAYQGLFKTCTYLAGRGLRDVGDGKERVACVEQLARLKSRGRRVSVMTVVSAAAATAMVVLASR